MKLSIIDICKQIEDPRINRRKVYKMEHIIYIAITAVICGAQSWNEIETFGRSKIAFFQKRLPDLDSIPCHDTFNRFFSMLDPKHFELIFRNWVKLVCQEVKGVVAIDGKLMRGSSKCDAEHTTGRGDFKLWMVSAWSAANGLSLGQEKVDEKSNEIDAVPKLISALDLQECIVTIDAMGCQTKITEAIIERGGDYIIALKENQPKSYELARDLVNDFTHSTRKKIAATHVSETTGHGRTETRTSLVINYGADIMEKMFKSKFVGLKSVVGVTSERIVHTTGKITKETRYFITSLDNNNPEEVANAVRQHWSIENNLHWQLDVTFHEDQSRKVKNAARNFSAITKIALAVLKNDKTTKGSMNLKRLKAGWDDKYLETLMQSGAF